jgi:hypothetical protein
VSARVALASKGHISLNNHILFESKIALEFLILSKTSQVTPKSQYFEIAQLSPNSYIVDSTDVLHRPNVL